MASHRTLARALTVLTVVGSLGFTAPASAAGYDLFGRVPKAGAGAGEATGSIKFINKFRFKWTAAVRDVCPADGSGVELQFVVRHLDGTQTVRKNIVRDLNGCGGRAESGAGAIKQAKRIKNVMVVLYSTEGGTPWITLDLSRNKDNPHT